MSAKLNADKPVLTVEFGRRDDEHTWVSFRGLPPKIVTLIWPGPLRQAGDLALIINGIPAAITALTAARANCRNPDTDCALSLATGEQIDVALAGFGVRP